MPEMLRRQGVLYAKTMQEKAYLCGAGVQAFWAGRGIAGGYPGACDHDAR